MEICLIQLPGRENRVREPHYGTYEELAVQLAESLHNLGLRTSKVRFFAPSPAKEMLGWPFPPTV